MTPQESPLGAGRQAETPRDYPANPTSSGPPATYNVNTDQPSGPAHADDATGGAVDRVEQVAGSLIEGAKHLAEQAVEGTKHTAGDATDRVAGAVKDTALRQTISLLAGQKDDAALILAEAARALQQTGARLRTQDKADVAQTTDGAAAQLERLSGYLSAHAMEEIVADAERLAATIPAGVLSGALVVGLLGGRLLNKLDD